ncbi:hypothetical protein NQ318_002283 [Aromia moschata]|uniref:Uncharacterized protein n=1 Tax=Aromia moschata TaxID=1265417 RepID=A0AAV8Z2Y9_9CUCU|nr:hypothetical protein NQ318_002283 [Aromia moschata]
MGTTDPGPKRCKDPSDDPNIKNGYNTEFIVRSKGKIDVPRQVYDTTPGDRLSSKVAADKQRQLDDARRHCCISQFDYLRNNLRIKSCVGNREVFRFQMKKITIRNYTPKILRQEVNMGMWI